MAILLVHSAVGAPPQKPYSSHNGERKKGKVQYATVQSSGTFIIKPCRSFGTYRTALAMHGGHGCEQQTTNQQ